MTNNNTFVCPFCETINFKNKDNYNEYFPSLKTADHRYVGSMNDLLNNNPSIIKLEFQLCGNCNKVSIKTDLIGSNFDENRSMIIYPSSNAKVFDDIVPESIRIDYKEAYEILEISPRASATLARRAIQTIIKERFNAKGRTLYDQIESIKGGIYQGEFDILDSIRNLGNIGAHSENDLQLIINIESNDAKLILYCLEFLIEEWYIKSSERMDRIKQLKDLAKSKNNLRSSKRNNKK